MDRMLRHWMRAALALSLTAGTALAADQGGAPGDWLTRWSGARTLGMGGAFVASADDALGALWNPAGLSWLSQNELAFENARLYQDTGVNAFGFAVPGSRLPSFGVSIVSLGSSGFERTDEMNNPLGTFDESETAFLFTLSHAISPKLSMGANFKIVRQSIESFSGGGTGMDLGAMYQATPTLRLGASWMNLGGPAVTLRDTKESWPGQLRAGASMAMFNGRGQVGLEVDHADGTDAALHGGAEYWIQPAFAVRAGYDVDRGTGGVSWRFNPRTQLDYAVADHALGMTHRLALRWRFGGFFASSEADPAVFSPSGEQPVTRIRLNAHTKADADNWTLVFLDKKDVEVRRFGGPGLPPPHLLWDGKDEAGLPLADGVYRYRLEVRDHAGRVVSSAMHKVEISTGGPQGSVPVIPAP